jgi:hypothetical protein
MATTVFCDVTSSNLYLRLERTCYIKLQCTRWRPKHQTYPLWSYAILGNVTSKKKNTPYKIQANSLRYKILRLYPLLQYLAFLPKSQEAHTSTSKACTEVTNQTDTTLRPFTSYPVIILLLSTRGRYRVRPCSGTQSVFAGRGTGTYQTNS